MTDTLDAIHGEQKEALIIRIDRAIHRFARHWLLVFNVVAFIIASIPFLAPFLASQRLSGLSGVLHTFMGLICHQDPEHSFTIFGEQMALDHRCTAIYLATFVTAVGYSFVRGRVSPLGFLGLLLLAAPMALDGFTQLGGLRESNWALRIITGSLFAFGVMWFALPRLEFGFAEIRTVVEQRFDKLLRQGRARPL